MFVPSRSWAYCIAGIWHFEQHMSLMMEVPSKYDFTGGQKNGNVAALYSNAYRSNYTEKPSMNFSWGVNEVFHVLLNMWRGIYTEKNIFSLYNIFNWSLLLIEATRHITRVEWNYIFPFYINSLILENNNFKRVRASNSLNINWNTFYH